MNDYIAVYIYDVKKAHRELSGHRLWSRTG